MCAYNLQEVTDQLSAQRRLNADQQNTINDLLRKTKGIDTKIPTNVSGASDVSHKVCRLTGKVCKI